MACSRFQCLRRGNLTPLQVPLLDRLGHPLRRPTDGRRRRSRRPREMRCSHPECIVQSSSVLAHPSKDIHGPAHCNGLVERSWTGDIGIEQKLEPCFLVDVVTKHVVESLLVCTDATKHNQQVHNHNGRVSIPVGRGLAMGRQLLPPRQCEIELPEIPEGHWMTESAKDEHRVPVCHCRMTHSRRRSHRRRLVHLGPSRSV